MKLAPRKCETPGCLAPPCPVDWDPEGIDVAHKLRAAWIWECDCGWLVRIPAMRLGLIAEQPRVSDHLNDVVDRTIVAAGDKLLEELGLGPKPVLFDASKDGVAVGVELTIP